MSSSSSAGVFVVPVPSSNELSVSVSSLFWNASISRILDNAIAFRTYASKRVDFCLSMFLHCARKFNKKKKQKRKGYYVRIGHRGICLIRNANLGVWEKNVKWVELFLPCTWLAYFVAETHAMQSKTVGMQIAGFVWSIYTVTIEQTLWNRLQKNE